MSLIDYPGKIACVIFVTGCNYACGYCHNRVLVKHETQPISIEEIEEFLNKRKNQLEAVVISGGEPTINHKFIELVTLAKSLGYLVKVDTNGTQPNILSNLTQNRLVDYIAMDIKTTIDKYSELTHFNNNDVIKQSIELIMSSSIEYEFRTTVTKDDHQEVDFHKIGQMIQGTKKYVIQNYRFSQQQINEKQYTPLIKDELDALKDVMKHYVKEVIVRDHLS